MTHFPWFYHETNGPVVVFTREKWHVALRKMATETARMSHGGAEKLNSWVSAADQFWPSASCGSFCEPNELLVSSYSSYLVCWRHNQWTWKQSLTLLASGKAPFLVDYEVACNIMQLSILLAAGFYWFCAQLSRFFSSCLDLKVADRAPMALAPHSQRSCNRWLVVDTDAGMSAAWRTGFPSPGEGDGGELWLVVILWMVDPALNNLPACARNIQMVIYHELRGVYQSGFPITDVSQQSKLDGSPFSMMVHRC